MTGVAGAAHMTAVLRDMQQTLAEIEARCACPLGGGRLVAFEDMLFAFASDVLEAAHADGEELDASEFDELMACIEATQDRIALLNAAYVPSQPQSAYPEQITATN